MNKYHNGMMEQTAGLRARVGQVKTAYAQEENMVRAMGEYGRGMTGALATRGETRVAERALERQIRYQRGQYPVR